MSRKKKAFQASIEVTKYAAEGKSIGQLEDGKVVFIENAIPGDVVEVRIGKSKKSYAEGKVVQLLQPSPNRIEPFCQHFGVCGGCKWQMLPYEQQLQYKQQQVLEQLTHIGKIELPPFQPILGSEQTRFYRNKLEFTFSARQYLTRAEIDASAGAPIEHQAALGFHAPGMFDKVVAIQQCHLQPDPSNGILNALRNISKQYDLPYYDFKAQEGWWRNVVIRVSTFGEVLVNLIVFDERPELFTILDTLLVQFPHITSLNYTINSKKNDTIYDLDVVCYKGRPYIFEQLGHVRFKISPKSFFQTNSQQAERLYAVTKSFAELTGSENLYDLYCGTGSIGLYCADKTKNVVGVETVEDAIEDAKFNAAYNHIDNTHFYAGDVIKIVNDTLYQKHGKPDVVITDPPRAGMHDKLIEQLIVMDAPTVVYVSCNPATQARDLQLLDAHYQVTKVQPVDMFPHTHHIENVVQLKKRI